MDCGPLSPPVNGVVDQLRGTRFMDETFYTCLDGYVLTPSDSQTRICTETGQWSGSDPTCECEQSYLTNSDINFRCFYSCTFLHRSSLSPSLSLFPPPVRASTVDCGSLPFPSNGLVTLLNSSTGRFSLVQYSCLPGFMLVGETLRQCQTNGQWSGMAPTCIGEWTLLPTS